MPSWLENKTKGSSSRVKTTFDEQKSSRKDSQNLMVEQQAIRKCSVFLK